MCDADLESDMDLAAEHCEEFPARAWQIVKKDMDVPLNVFSCEVKSEAWPQCDEHSKRPPRQQEAHTFWYTATIH